MLDKKQIQVIFLFKLKMGCKAAETTHSINNALAQELLTLQWWFREFCKGDKRFEDKERSGQPLEVDNGQLRAVVEAGPHTVTQELAEELSVDHSTIIGRLKQIRKVKKLAKYMLHLCVHAKLLQSCLTLCDPMDYSPPGSSVHGILQARIPEWVARLSSRGASWADHKLNK